MTSTATCVAAPAPRAHDLQNISARELAARIATREFPSAEVVEHFIARLKTVNGKLNAVTADLSESARQAAADVDKALACGEKLGPLAGVPVTIKECFDLAGTASTFGLTTRHDEIENKDDPYAAAPRAAGAIPIAKTNLPQRMIFTGRTPDYCAHGLPVGQTGIVSQVGPMARYVEHLVVGLRALDRARDPFVIPGPELGDPAAVDLSRLRFAACMDDSEFPVAPAARRAVAEAAQFLIAAGAKEVAWKAPPLRRATDLLFASLSADRTESFRWRDHVALAAMAKIEAAARTQPDYPARPSL